MEMERRKKLTREVLDAGNNINAMVSRITRSMIMGMDEEATPCAQLNQEDIDKMEASAVALRHILEKKVFLGHQLENEAHGEQLLSNARVVEMAHVEEPLAAYNNCLLYTSPSPRD